MKSMPNGDVAFLKRDPIELQLYSDLKTAQQRVKNWPGNLPVPVLCAVGMQSAGKTTFIEALVGFRVGTTCAGTGTRCPVRYILKDGEPSFSVGGKRVTQRSDIQVAVERHMEVLAKMPNDADRFSKEELKVEITDHHLPPLDITDLPGLKAKGEGADEIKSVVRFYVQSQSARPVVLVKATESVETQADVELLRDVGIDPKKGNATFVVNYFNDQLYKFAKASELNEYCQGYVKEYGCVFFVMLIYSQEAKDEKDRLDFEGQCAYYRELPQKELYTFNQKVSSMTPDVEFHHEDVTKRFGVAAAITKMQLIIRDFVIREGRRYSDRLRALEEETDDQLRVVQKELKRCHPDYIKEQREKYVERWGEVVRDFQKCKKRLDNESDFNPMDSSMTFFEELIEVHDKDTQTTLLGMNEENTVKAWEDAANKMREQAYSQLGFAKEELQAKLTADAGLWRLTKVFDFVIDTQVTIEAVLENEARSISGYAPGDMPGAFDQLQVVKEVATRPLTEVKQKIQPLLFHVESIYKKALELAHSVLKDHSGYTASLEKRITESYNICLRRKIEALEQDFKTILVDKTLYMPVEHHWQSVPVNSREVSVVHQRQSGPVNSREVSGAFLGLVSQSICTIPCLGLCWWFAIGKEKPEKPWIAAAIVTGIATIASAANFIRLLRCQPPVAPTHTPSVEGLSIECLNAEARHHCQRLKKELARQFETRVARGLFDYLQQPILVEVRDDIRQQIRDMDARRIDDETRARVAELRLKEEEHKESLGHIRKVLASIELLEGNSDKLGMSSQTELAAV